MDSEQKRRRKKQRKLAGHTFAHTYVLVTIIIIVIVVVIIMILVPDSAILVAVLESRPDSLFVRVEYLLRTSEHRRVASPRLSLSPLLSLRKRPLAPVPRFAPRAEADRAANVPADE